MRKNTKKDIESALFCARCTYLSADRHEPANKTVFPVRQKPRRNINVADMFYELPVIHDHMADIGMMGQIKQMIYDYDFLLVSWEAK